MLCWAVVFADIGTSVYYTPGILFGQVGAHAALFVAMTLIVFVLLTLKYSEVAIRYPEGGGVVSVGAHAVNPFVGLVGGLFILVDYFLTSALSALSGVIYLSVVAPGLGKAVIPLTVFALVLLAGLNLFGISADAKVTAVIACVAVASQLGVIIAVLAHAGIGTAVGAISKVGSGPPLSGVALLTGYAGAFLAFSGLESVSQLAPEMAEPRKRTAPRAMILVVIAIVITSPLLTLWSTTLLNVKGSDPNQFISLLGGYAAGPLLKTEVAASAALLLVFASNTAIIGCYHVFIALARMRFLPQSLQRTNHWRGTPHWAILVATVIPVAIVVASRGSVGLLGDLYAFGLLGAFSVTCVCLDIVRWRERSAGRPAGGVRTSSPLFVIGIATSVLVVAAWSTNLFAKPLATAFGGAVTGLGLCLAGLTHRGHRRRGEPGVIPVVRRLEQVWTIRRRGWAHDEPVVAVLSGTRTQVEAVTRVALDRAEGGPVILAYAGALPTAAGGRRRLRAIADPYLVDAAAHDAIGAARQTAAPLSKHAHALYLEGADRAAALSALWESVRPSAVVTVAHDGALAGLLEQPGHTLVTTDGVSVIAGLGTAPAGTSPGGTG
ncbi:MAG: hypothetical protein NVSMB29_18670 [Candidatus Dormibacteria bacterium]